MTRSTTALISKEIRSLQRDRSTGKWTKSERCWITGAIYGLKHALTIIRRTP